MTPTRKPSRPIFDPNALDDLDDMWPATPQSQSETPAQHKDAVAPATAAPSGTIRPASGRSTHTLASQSAQTPPRPAAPPRAVATEQATRARPTHATAATQGAVKRTRPPEALLSAEVYDELYRVQIAEKKTRKGLARSMGTIVMDAIEAHADRLESTWTTPEYEVGEGQLFERPSSNAVPRRRRHATAPRTVVLSGITAANGERLDNLVQRWNAGTRSALVEQALRYEFGLLA